MPTPVEVLAEYEKEFLKSAIDLVIEKATGGMNGEKYLSEITDIIDPARELKPAKRLAELHYMAMEVKRKL